MRETEEEAVGPSRRQPQSFAAYRLPPGKHGIPPEQVVENQRWRLLGAAAEALVQRGYAGIRAADVCAQAGVSRETFYEHFEDLEDCLHAAYEMTADCVLDLASAACEGDAKSGDGVKRALDEVLEFLAEEPALAHLLGPETAAGVPAIAAARERLMRELASTGVDQRRVEGALAVVSEQSVDDPTRLPALADQLAVLIDRGRATDAVR